MAKDTRRNYHGSFPILVLKTAAQETSDIGNLVSELVWIGKRVNHDDTEELKSSLILLSTKKLMIRANL